ncbi:MAG: prephenate dehydratase [Bacteroidetes bacterium]|nr:prephenate dehydratase [Bacteroidota bacterium]
MRGYRHVRWHLAVAYQGEPGAFSELAVRKVFGKKAATLPCASFASVFEAVRRGRARAGVVPVENAVFGPIHETRDLLLSGGIVPVGEVTLRIRLCLLGLPGATERSIRTVASQPQALGQCGRFLLSRGRLQLQPVNDTAAAARLVQEYHDPSLGCVAGRQAARPYGLRVLREGIEDNPENYTRFLVIRRGRKSPPVSRRRASTTMLVASLQHRAGSLHRLLGAFAEAGVNLRSITARPRTGRPWEYLFHLDIDGRPGDPPVARALEAARKVSILMRVVGSFVRGRTHR